MDRYGGLGDDGTSVANAAFDTVTLPSPFWASNPSGTSWTFSSSHAGISSNSGAFVANQNAPSGTQFGFIQTTGTLSQNVQFFAAGTYVISFQAAQRMVSGVANNQDFDIYVDGVLVNAATHLKPTNGNWQAMSSNGFTVDAGTHTILFQGVDTATGDNSVLIDSVVVINANSSPFAGIDTSVLRIDTSYNTQDLLEKH